MYIADCGSQGSASNAGRWQPKRHGPESVRHQRLGTGVGAGSEGRRQVQRYHEKVGH